MLGKLKRDNWRATTLQTVKCGAPVSCYPPPQIFLCITPSQPFSPSTQFHILNSALTATPRGLTCLTKTLLVSHVSVRTRRAFGNYPMVSTLASTQMSPGHTNGLNEGDLSPQPHPFHCLYMLGPHSILRKRNPVALQVHWLIQSPYLTAEETELPKRKVASLISHESET